MQTVETPCQSEPDAKAYMRWKLTLMDAEQGWDDTHPLLCVAATRMQASSRPLRNEQICRLATEDVHPQDFMLSAL